MVRAMRTALVCKPGMSEGQSVTNLSCRIPWVIAGAGKLAPAANDPAPARMSRRLMVALSPKSFGSASGTCFAGRISLGHGIHVQARLEDDAQCLLY
jgi:hypothetical protein